MKRVPNRLGFGTLSVYYFKDGNIPLNRLILQNRVRIPATLPHVHPFTGIRRGFIKAMFFELAGERLAVPGRRAWCVWVEIPKGIFRRVIPPIIQRLSGQPFLRFPCSLIEHIAFLHRFKRVISPLDLENDVFNRPEITEVRTIRHETVHDDISDIQHPLLAFPFGFRPHHPSHQIHICIPVIRSRHFITPPTSYEKNLRGSTYSDDFTILYSKSVQTV